MFSVRENLGAVRRRLKNMDLGLRQWVSAKLPLPEVASADGKTRLNLGCGDKILPGFINVDIAPSRKGLKPDVLSDLTKLPFANAMADEILSVHVVEHFYYWEIKRVLKEWLRVLKPGGKLIIECPNLATAAETLLADPSIAALPGREGQKSMWVFYGDPSWRDPLMCHKWGYTPASLKELLVGMGLTDVTREKAQYKLGEPRDMRMVGTKPHAN